MEDIMGASTVFEQFSEKGKIESFYGNEAFQGSSRKDPKKVAAMFEAIFYRILFKQNKEAELEDSFFGSSEMSTMKDMRNDELANQLGAMGQLGIMDMVEKFLERSTSDKVVSPDKFKERFGIKGGLLKG
jgi:Rod binding domain-containing protein